MFRKPLVDVDKTVPGGWVVFTPGTPHVKANIQGVIVQIDNGMYYPTVYFRGKKERYSGECSLRVAVKVVREALDGIGQAA